MLVAVTQVVSYFQYPEINETGRRLVQRYRERSLKSSDQAREALKVGTRADEILAVAGEDEVDLDRQGLGAVSRILRGSVSISAV